MAVMKLSLVKLEVSNLQGQTLSILRKQFCASCTTHSTACAACSTTCMSHMTNMTDISSTRDSSNIITMWYDIEIQYILCECSKGTAILSV